MKFRQSRWQIQASNTNCCTERKRTGMRGGGSRLERGPCRMHWPERSPAVLESPRESASGRDGTERSFSRKRAIGARHAPEGETGCERRMAMRKYGITLALFLIILVE